MTASKFVTVRASPSWAGTAPAIEKAWATQVATTTVWIFMDLLPLHERLIFVLHCFFPALVDAAPRRPDHLHDADRHSVRPGARLSGGLPHCRPLVVVEIVPPS